MAPIQYGKCLQNQKKYITAFRLADNSDIQPLIEFVKINFSFLN